MITIGGRGQNLIIVFPTPTRVCHWRLDESFLKKPVREELGQRIFNYFQLNVGSVGSQGILWEEHKAVFRGHCIALGSRIKRNTALQIESLSTQLRSLEAKLAVNPSKLTLRCIVATRSKLKALSMGRVEKLRLYSQHRFYKRANKAHTLLAKMLRDDKDQRNPHLLRTRTGSIILISILAK